MVEQTDLEKGTVVLNEKVSQVFFKLILVDGLLLGLIALLLIKPLSTIFMIVAVLTVAYCELMIFRIGKNLKKLGAG